MKIHPAIAALRETPASQRRSSSSGGAARTAEALASARAQWLASPQVGAVAEDLARFGAGGSLRACAALRALVHDHSAARRFAEGLIGALLAHLRQRPLGEAPFRFKVSRGLATIQLMEDGGATLSLVAYEPLAQAEPPRTALFSDREVHEIALSGEASGVRHMWQGEGDLVCEPLRWRAGDTIRLRPRCEARQVLGVARSLLLLQLTREPARPAPTRLVSLETGETLRTASGDKSASQTVMALGVLGALREYSALDVMERTALNRNEDSEVRWEAVRQSLALGPARGLAILSALAARAGDTLCAPAGALKTQLLDAQPGLRALVQERPVECR